MQRLALFIDLSNVYYAAREAGVEVDYRRLLPDLTGDRSLVRAYTYTGVDPENETQKAFHAFLRELGYTVVAKEVRRFADGAMKANLDIELVVDLLRLAPKIDVAIVISGDGDFAPAIRAVQEMGVRVEVAGFRRKTSLDLLAVADTFLDLATVCVDSGRPVRRRTAAAPAKATARTTDAPVRATTRVAKAAGARAPRRRTRRSADRTPAQR